MIYIGVEYWQIINKYYPIPEYYAIKSDSQLFLMFFSLQMKKTFVVKNIYVGYVYMMLHCKHITIIQILGGDIQLRFTYYVRIHMIAAYI